MYTYIYIPFKGVWEYRGRPHSLTTRNPKPYIQSLQKKPASQKEQVLFAVRIADFASTSQPLRGPALEATSAGSRFRGSGVQGFRD